ncbi:MAG: TrkH family potassium uptake protein [Treponema sp.]|jgi:trk system potassium uptake protein TrkH|nr:TrkH family potassium uptake protein [Treponema sp.]
MKRQFLLVFLAWLGACLFGALPFYFSGYIPNFTDAVFESTSGFTTTGATVLVDIEALPKWLLFWRAITQWLGGMGIVLLVAALLPLFEAGSFHLVKADTHGMHKEKFVPRISLAAKLLWLLYVSLTALQILLLAFFGMSWFDAVTHAFSTMSTGGFSVRNNSIAYYNSPGIEWVCIVFMFLAGFNFALIWQLLRGKLRCIMRRKPDAVIRNSEARAYTGIVLIAAIIITIAIFPKSPSFGTGEVHRALRQAFFQVTSLISTSGLYSADYSRWPSAALGILFFLLFIGGCSGSTAGGIKVIRYVILSKQMWNEMKRVVYPKGIFSIQLNGKSGKKAAVHGVAGFVFLYFLILFFTALLVSTSGADVFSSINTAVICQGNTGLGLGDPGVFKFFPDYVKWGLCLVMITGRLELWAVLILFTGDFWRK